MTEPVPRVEDSSPQSGGSPLGAAAEFVALAVLLAVAGLGNPTGFPYDRRLTTRSGRRAERTEEAPIRAAGILLAAGRSTRMGGGAKLLRDYRGKPLVRWAAEALLEGGLCPVVVVLGPNAQDLRQALRALPVRFVDNPRFEEGMATSLSAGVASLPLEVSTAVVALGDMPLVSGAIVRDLVGAFAASDKSIAVPVHEGRRGHPAVFDLRRHGPALLRLTGDRGARALLEACPEEVLEVLTPDSAVLRDVDTAADLRALEGGLQMRCAGGDPLALEERTVLEINTLWEPVYPFMVDHLVGISGFTRGRFLDLGPFAGGLALNLLWRNEGALATVCDESPGVLRWVEERAADGGYVSRLTTVRAAVDPIPAAPESFELLAVRGAFFFATPSLLQEVRRVLKPGGFGWVGGGYGPATPTSVIAPLSDRSRDLNARIGKRRIEANDARKLVADSGLADSAKVSTDGGLWIEVRA